ncbi:uncharacterized protein LOC135397534 [Ornithodoros turicata]|uniref:uncharacterized protein LOC135397534 n=1 Tax=Ornithodoros turicata TaxID=34597 RepID=UPI003139987D
MGLLPLVFAFVAVAAEARRPGVLRVQKWLPTVEPQNMTLDETEDVLALTCTVGYTNFAAIFWTIYDRDLRDLSHIEETTTMLDDNQTYAKVSVIRIGGWTVLPSRDNVYPFKCNSFADFKVASTTTYIHTALTDYCGPEKPGKCEARGGRCVDKHCTCADDRHPLRLNSLHTVCWPEAKLGSRCYFNEQCSTPKSECVVSMGWCACAPGFARSGLSPERCEPRLGGGLRSRCSQHADCSPYNAICTYNHCECLPGTRALTHDAASCVNVTMNPAPRMALQEMEPLQSVDEPETLKFGQAHKHIRDAPIFDQ